MFKRLFKGILSKNYLQKIRIWKSKCMLLYNAFILCLFLTPLYLGFLSSNLGLIIHPNKNRKDDYNEDLICYILIYSTHRGLLMFPYIILFFQFMVILLLPGIFSYRYYLYIYNAYATALMPVSFSLKNVGDNKFSFKIYFKINILMNL